MKITQVTRYFERTRQIADFIPVKSAIEVTAEVHEGETIADVSRQLDELAVAEVEKTLMGYTPACIACGGKAIFPKKVLNKEGICAQCQSDNDMKLRDLKKAGTPK